MIVCSDNIFFNVNAADIALTLSVPVELINFEGQKREKTVQLSWATATEENNDYFIVERSVNGIDFQFLNQQKGFGTTSNINRYNLIDKAPLNGMNYYRLIQVDYDGTRHIQSEIVAVEFVNGSALSVIPNPVKSDFINVNYSTEQGGDLELNIYDLNGHLIHQTLATTEKGNNNFTLSMPDLPNGVYLIKAVKVEDFQTIRFVKSQ